MVRLGLVRCLGCVSALLRIAGQPTRKQVPQAVQDCRGRLSTTGRR
jgi:hypothetical protein